MHTVPIRYLLAPALALASALTMISCGGLASDACANLKHVCGGVYNVNFDGLNDNCVEIMEKLPVARQQCYDDAYNDDTCLKCTGVEDADATDTSNDDITVE